MPIFQTFVMGEKETYFFNTPTHWAWHNLPADIEALFTKQPPLRDVIELAIGPSSSYFISYRDHDNQLLCKHYNLPNPLTEYLYASHPHVIRDLTTLSITLGPYDSYYAWDKSTASWSNLPSSLEKGVLARLEHQDAWSTKWKAGGAEAPCFVSLGADGAYFMRTVCGGGTWDLKCGKEGDGRKRWEGLNGTNKFLEQCPDFCSVAGLHLFPSHANAYILILTNGKAFSNLPECTWVDYNKMSAALPTSVQSMQPIPPIPQPKQPHQQSQPQPQPQPQFQQPHQPQQQTHHHYQPPSQHNCCPQPLPGQTCCSQAQQVQTNILGLVPVYGNPPIVQQVMSYMPQSQQQTGVAYR
ncbi:hypothetical protein ACN47E_007191 [Coniothyrium glycines]